MRLRVRAHPRAARERVVLLPDGSLAVWVQAPAHAGQANAAIERAVARALGLRPGQVALVHGARSRDKWLEVPLDAAALQRRLDLLVPPGSGQEEAAPSS